jgi:hypothetical protein
MLNEIGRPSGWRSVAGIWKDLMLWRLAAITPSCARDHGARSSPEKRKGRVSAALPDT